MKKNMFMFLFILLIISVINILHSQNLTQKDLQADLSYYYKITTQRKDLSANDKLYILERIHKKYKNTNLDLTQLVKEIETVKAQQEKTSIKSESKISNPPSIEQSTSSLRIESQKSTEDTKKFIEDEKYKVSAGDILYIRVFPAEDLSTEVIVSPDGKISFPLLGSVKVEGLTIKELQQLLEKNLSVYISKPKVSIVIRYFAKKQIFIMGEIRSPGGYQYSEGLKLFELISLAGGFTPYAGTKNIKIYRGEKGKQKTIVVNFDEIVTDTSKDILLEPGDIIEVPKQPKSISVIGAVISPGSFEWQDNLDILKALSLAGGPSDIADLSSVRIFRENPDGTKQLININAKKLLKGDLRKNIKLQPADVVYVPKKPFVSGQWIVNTLLPWTSLIISIFIIITYLK
ncbi:MAG: polysaccharide export protein [Endomicrobia bacterium]|nr:polysaccharide export protein [Endomicrobiia bacterium]